MDRGVFIFPVQLTTSRIGNLTRLIHTLAICATIHTYMLAIFCCRSYGNVEGVWSKNCQQFLKRWRAHTNGGGTSHEPNSINNGITGYVRKRKRKEVQEYVTIKPEGLIQRFEGSEEGDRQIRCLQHNPEKMQQIMLKASDLPVALFAFFKSLTQTLWFYRHIYLYLIPLAFTYFFSFLFFFHLTYSRWTSSLPSCLWSQRIFPSLPGSRLTIFLSRCKLSTLTTRQPMVEFYLLTFPRFPLRKKEHKFYFGKNRTHDFRTSRCAAYLLDHSGNERLHNL